MSTKTFRLKIRKIPNTVEFEYKRPNFPRLNDLHLELLENKTKLKKNPPKPLFVYESIPPPTEQGKKGDSEIHDGDEDFTLEELEKAYDGNTSEESGSDSEKHAHHDKPEGTHSEKAEYKQEEFNKEAEEEESAEEVERKKKADLLFKFMVLKKQYPNVEIPDFTDQSDLKTMEIVYERVIQRVSLDSSVENYRGYLIGGFMVLEWIATNWMAIDLSGFTQHQIKMMNKYDRLLIELGEKNYSTAGSRFPVEVRLLGLILFNAGLFYIQKAVFSGGDGGMNLLGSLFGGGEPQAQKQAKRGTMKGPTITPDDVESLNDSKDSSSKKEE